LYRKAYATNGASEATRAQRANASVLKTEGTGWDVGHAVKFLLSDYARYITGQVRVVDGGVTLRGPGRDFASLSPNSGSGHLRRFDHAPITSGLPR
jgi:Enoyl-(Acyl carrier protein) reductase